MSFFKIFHKIGRAVVDSLQFQYGLNYALAGALTYLIVISGLDVAWKDFSLVHLWIWQAGFAAVFVGALVPVFAPLGMYIYGRVRKSLSAQVAGLALGQAAILGLAVSSIIKVFTGRIPPEYEGIAIGNGGFRFGVWEGGAFNGWPSSHTTEAFAMAVALTLMYPGNRAVKIGAWAYAIFIGLGVSTNNHWFSDVVAGALIGYAIGRSIGVRFSKDFKKTAISAGVQ